MTQTAGTGQWRRQLADDESQDGNVKESKVPTDASSSSSGSSYESDWEYAVNDEGELFYLVQYSQNELLHESIESSSKKDVAKATESGVKSQARKKSGKLSRLIRRRESKRERNAPVQEHLEKFRSRQSRTTPSHAPESSDNESSNASGGQLKTFESMFKESSPNEMHEISLKIKGRKYTEPGRSLVEQMMGIVPVRQGLVDEEEHYLSSVTVAAFLPDGPAIKLSPKILVGDIIRLVDGQQVNLSTIEQLLSTYNSSCKVKLTIHRPLRLPSIDNLSSLDESSGSSAYMTSNGDTLASSKIKALLKRLPCLVLYCTRNGITETSPETADVLYQYPLDQETKTGSPLTSLHKIRGILMTVSQVLPEILGTKPMVTSILLGNQLMHVGLAEEKEDLFILTLPHLKRTAKEVCNIVRDVVRVLRFQFESLANAFWSERKGFPEDINKILGSLMVNQLTGVYSGLDAAMLIVPNLPLFEEALPACQWLVLPDDIQFQIDDAVSQYESADFQDFSEEFYDLPREFDILGSCLFHRGLLLASHLHREDLIDVFHWCQSYKLLTLMRKLPVHQLVAWKEVFLSRRNQRLGKHLESSGNASERTFLLAVGLEHQLFVAILQTGGLSAELADGIVKPDPFYVDQAMNTLDHLDEMGIPLVCEKWLTLPNNPETINIDKLYENALGKRKNKSSLGPSTLDRKLPEKGIVLRKTKIVEQGSIASTSSGGSQADLGSAHNEEGRISQNSFNRSSTKGDDIASDVSEDELKTEFREEPPKFREREDDNLLWELHRSGQRSKLNISDDANEDPIPEDTDEFVTYHVSQLTISPENTLFHYVHLEVGEGIFLAPLDSSNTYPLHAELLSNFRAACQLIHSTFEASLRSREAFQQPPTSPSASRAWVSKSLVAVKEQGMLFQWAPRPGPKGHLPLLSYWVCGRLFLGPNPRECYVCYHDSAPQNVIELAFKLTHGAHI